MPAQRQCSFCGNKIDPGTGLMYVKNDGSIQWFCSSKCRKFSLRYNKDPKKYKWTTKYIRGKQ